MSTDHYVIVHALLTIKYLFSCVRIFPPSLPPLVGGGTQQPTTFFIKIPYCISKVNRKNFKKRSALKQRHINMNLLSKLPIALLAFSTTKDRSKELKRLASSMDVEIPVLKVLLKKQRAKMKNDEGNNKKAQYIDWVLAKETGKETKSARKLSARTIISTSSKGAANQRKQINSKAKPTTVTATLTATDEEKRKQKKETLSKLKSMATKQREKMNKKQVQMSDRPPVTIKQQVATAVQSRKESAKASASACTNNRDHDGGKSFMELGVPSNLVKGLTEMGIVDPTPIQKKAIPHAIKGKDVMGLAQTGTGKTLAFGLPLVSQMLEEIEISTINYKGDRNAMRVSGKKKPIRGLVLAPTRELANQIAVSLGTLTQNTPIQSFVVVGGQNIKTQINKLRDGTDLLVATPGRLIDLMDRGALSLSGTTFLVLDEADLMLDMGFMPSLRKIEKMLPKKRQTMLFSATMAKDMNVVARSFLKDPVRVEVAKAGRTADKIVQELHFIPKADKTAKLLELLSDPDNRNDRSIVFGRTKHGMEKLSKKLIAAGIEAGSIHGM